MSFVAIKKAFSSVLVVERHVRRTNVRFKPLFAKLYVSNTMVVLLFFVQVTNRKKGAKTKLLMPI